MNCVEDEGESRIFIPFSQLFHTTLNLAGHFTLLSGLIEQRNLFQNAKRASGANSDVFSLR